VGVKAFHPINDDDVHLYILQTRVLEICTICFHIDQPERYKYKKLSIIRNKWPINNNEAKSIKIKSINNWRPYWGMSKFSGMYLLMSICTYAFIVYVHVHTHINICVLYTNEFLQI
jgi:hypothetical protein